LITWFVFALYLHTRIVMGWKGKRSAIIAIVGFLAALFTYFGVNYLLAGLHSYA
jgi:ABC-type transport system involved in cytochrome c biogenesis permease subunit